MLEKMATFVDTRRVSIWKFNFVELDHVVIHVNYYKKRLLVLNDEDQ